MFLLGLWVEFGTGQHGGYADVPEEVADHHPKDPPHQLHSQSPLRV